MTIPREQPPGATPGRGTSLIEKRRQKVFCFLCILLFSSCIPPPSGYKWYYVRKGDNLWSIARKNETDVFKLIHANSIKNPSRIYPGMRIKIPADNFSIKKTPGKPPRKTKKTSAKTRVPAGRRINFVWPAKGKVLRKFGKEKMRRWLGIVIETKETNIKAAAGGKITFCGNVSGFGRTVIIKHSSNYHTVYGYLGEISVKTGNKVSAGNVIGKPGRHTPFKKNAVYFEIRHLTEANDPLLYLD